MKINFVLPSVASRPSGGIQVMYEYANQMANKGHKVTIIHGIKQRHKKLKSPVWYKKLLIDLKGTTRPKWFKLNSQIRSIVVNEINNDTIPDADIAICTWWDTALDVAQLSDNKGVKYNLIQGYEVWDGHQELVHQTYSLNLQNITVSRYLQQLVKDITGDTPIYIPNAVDASIFYTSSPAQSRNPRSICMMYSNQELKGSVYGLEALKILKDKFPDLKVDFIGVPKKPKDLPDWIHYHRNPKNLREIYNQNSIFISPSLNEGWGLTCTEAMLCSCCLVCTDIGGHLEFAKNNITAKLVKPKDINALVQAIEELINDDKARLHIAQQGNEYVKTNFSWGKSADLLEKAFLSGINFQATDLIN